jgi:hypothetical protein
LLIKIVKIFLHCDSVTAKSLKHKPINKYSVMPDQDNVQMEKISLSGTDFAEDLGGNNDFGIQDTQVLATRELNKFLLTDPDDVKKIEEDEEAKKAEAEKQKQQQQQETPEQKKTREDAEKARKEKEAKESDGRKVLEGLLYNGEEEGEEGEQGQKKTVINVQKPGEEETDETYTTLGKDLLRLGVFTKNSEEETEETLNLKNPEEFLDRFNLEKKKGAINILENFLAQYGEDYRKMFDAVFVNGVKPQDYLQSFAKIEAIAGLDLANEENQERVVKAYYKSLKWDDAKIESKITKLKDYGDLEDEAKTYHEVLLSKEKDTAAAIEKAKADEIEKTKQKDATARKSYERILTEKLKNQEFDGLPLTQKEVQDTVAYMSEKKYKLASGELLSEYDKDLLELNRPESHELKVKLGLLLRKKLDLTSVKKTTISKKSDALFTLSTKNAKQNSNSKEKEMKSFF